MDYPAAKVSPVSPENDMWPKASDLMKLRDWTGSGILRTGYKRVWHVNRLIRRLAAEIQCVLIDIEKASYRLAIETVPDLSDGLNTFYDPANALHPLAPMFQTAIKPAIAQWAQAQAAGDFARRVFTGY